jgi:NADH dehydrogenase
LEDGQRIEAGTIIWAAGMVASPAAAWVDTERDRAGRVKVGADLSVPGKPNVFVIGDTAAVDTQAHSVPGVAPAAKQMGRYVGRLIRSRIAGQPLNEPFRYRHQGDLATIGRRSALVRLDRIQVLNQSEELCGCIEGVAPETPGGKVGPGDRGALISEKSNGM